MGPDIYTVGAIGNGNLALMPKPVSGEWIDDEFAGLARAGLTKVVSLLEAHEAKEVGLEDEDKQCDKNKMEFLRFPIVDRGIPADLDGYIALVVALHEEIVGGASIAVHCRAGIGRAGMLAASVLVRSGLNSSDAFALVSKARRVTVPDTDEQIEFVENISSTLAG